MVDRPNKIDITGQVVPVSDQEFEDYKTRLEEFESLQTTIPPDCDSLPNWRSALKYWLVSDGKGGQIARFDTVDSAIRDLELSKNEDGTPNTTLINKAILAREQFESSSVVLRDSLMKLAPLFGFTPSDVDESLWRANQVKKGDTTGVWPIITS